VNEGIAIRYVIGDATQFEGSGQRFICHVVNDVGAWGAGFTGALSKRWPEPEQVYRERFAMGTVRLGYIQFVSVTREICVVNMVAQQGIGRRPPMTGARAYHRTYPPIRYDALEVCLTSVRTLAMASHASVHMPRIGCGLGGGQWDVVEPLVRNMAAGSEPSIAVTVYDLPENRS